MNVEEIICLPEGPRIEFKENIKSTDKIIETIIAFANTSGGRIYVGISDQNRQVIGLDGDPYLILEGISSKIHDTISPRILPNIEIIVYRNIYILSIEIYPSSLRPHYLKTKGKDRSTYIRIGSTTRLADESLINVIQRSVTSKSYDEELCYESSCDEIDCTLVSQLFNSARIIHENELISLGVLRKNGDALLPTIAGVVLFSSKRLSYFPDAWIQVGVFEGIDKTHIQNTQEIKSYLPYAIEEVLNFIKKNIRIGIEIKDIKHTELWEIPKTALREAIVNAVVHTDYSLRGAPIRVSIFDDRIEIENSALLPWGYTFDELKSGISKLRNPTIGRIFKEIGLIEQWGSGITRMHSACEQAGIDAPQFQEIGPRIRVVFYKKKSHFIDLDETDKRIINLLTLYAALSTHEISTGVDISKRSIINRIARLIDVGQVVEISQGPNDPKKKYTLAKKERGMTMQDLIKNSVCNHQLEIINQKEIKTGYCLNIKIDNKKTIKFIFSKTTVEDHFIDNPSKYTEACVCNRIKDIMAEYTIFGVILLNSQRDPNVRAALEQSGNAEYIIAPELFGCEDFRSIGF